MAIKDGTLNDLKTKLSPLGEITHKSMFGGFGLFADGAMFAKISSKGVIAFKADDNNRPDFENAGMSKAGKIPYYEVAEGDESDTKKLRQWADGAMAAAKAAK